MRWGFSDPSPASAASAGRSSTSYDNAWTEDKRRDVLTKSRCDPKATNQGKNDAFYDLNNIKGLKIAKLNINSLPKHIEELRVIMADKPIQILAINETKLDHSISDQEISICVYNIIMKDRNRNGGGVLMYVQESIAFIERNDLCPNSLEIICAEIKKPHNKSFLSCELMGQTT